MQAESSPALVRQHANLSRLLRRQCRDRAPRNIRRALNQLPAAVAHQFSRAIRAAHIQHGCEISECSRKMAPAVVSEALFIAYDPIKPLPAALPGKSDQFVDRKALLTSIHGDAVDLARDDGAARETFGRFANEDLRPVGFVGALEAARDVHGIADHGIVQAQLGTDIADQHAARIDTDPDLERLAKIVGKARGRDRPATAERRTAAAQRVVGLRLRRAPEAMTASPMNLSMVPPLATTA